MKKLLILSVLFVCSYSLFSCTGDDLPTNTAINAANPGDPPVGGQGSTPPTPPTPPKP